jgi:hypothetical protein
MNETNSLALEKVQEAFNFTIDKFPLSGPDGMKTSFYGMFRSDNSECVGRPVTDRYVVHQTDDVLAITEAAMKAFDDENLDVKCHFRDGHFVSIAPPDSYRRQIFGTADNVFPRCIVNAGYDGRAFKTSLGYYRDLCSNLHIPRATDIAASVTIRHTSKLRRFMDELIQDFRSLGNSWDSMVKQIRFMQNREVNIVDFLNEIYPTPTEDSKRGLTVHKNRTEAILRRLMSERQRSGRPEIGQDRKVSAWEAFNAVQGYVQHDATRKKGFKSDMDRILLAAKDQSVIAAERLALAV